MDRHRFVDPTSVQVSSASAPFSCFDFVDQHFPDCESARRCFSLARSHGLKTVTVEPIPAAGLIDEENTEIGTRCPGHTMGGLVRLGFWSRPFKSVAGLGKCKSDALIGYAILKRDVVPSTVLDRWHVFEAVFRKYPHRHNCMPCQRRYKVRIGGQPFSVPGLLYCQQNGLNKACAHVALRSLLSRHVPAGDIGYSAINAIAAQAGGPAFDPGSGLTVPQMRAVLTGVGMRFRDIDYVKMEKKAKDVRRTLPYQKFLYAGIESGAGALLGFRLTGPAAAAGEKHIIPFFGHTFNKDTWVPDADAAYFDVGGGVGYIPSEAWTSSFLGHDDNFGPNLCAPRLYVRPDQADYVVELLNSGYTYSGVQAETIALGLLYAFHHVLAGSSNVWARRLALYAHQDVQRVVFRTVAASRDAYLRHLGSAADWGGKREDSGVVEILRGPLPRVLWVVEVSIPHLFPANERKLGEVLLDPGGSASGAKGASNAHLLLAARLPGQYLLPDGTQGGKPAFLTVPSRIVSHIPVLKLT